MHWCPTLEAVYGAYVWNMRGMCMEHGRTMNGTCMEYVWNMYGICMEYVWNMYAICMKYGWNMHDLIWNAREHELERMQNVL